MYALLKSIIPELNSMDVSASDLLCGGVTLYLHSLNPDDKELFLDELGEFIKQYKNEIDKEGLTKKDTIDMDNLYVTNPKFSGEENFSSLLKKMSISVPTKQSQSTLVTESSTGNIAPENTENRLPPEEHTQMGGIPIHSAPVVVSTPDMSSTLEEHIPMDIVEDDGTTTLPTLASYSGQQEEETYTPLNSVDRENQSKTGDEGKEDDDSFTPIGNVDLGDDLDNFDELTSASSL